jgi:hypothetical protein
MSNIKEVQSRMAKKIVIVGGHVDVGLQLYALNIMLCLFIDDDPIIDSTPPRPMPQPKSFCLFHDTEQSTHLLHLSFLILNPLRQMKSPRP